MHFPIYIVNTLQYIIDMVRGMAGWIENYRGYLVRIEVEEMAAYTIYWEVNEITKRWNKSHSFRAENDFKAIKYTVELMEDVEEPYKLVRTGFRGVELRTVIDCTDKVA